VSRDDGLDPDPPIDRRRTTRTDGEPAELQLYTADQAAALLQISPSWLRKKASGRQVPCTFVGRYLRFSAADLDQIIRAGTRPATS